MPDPTNTDDQAQSPTPDAPAAQDPNVLDFKGSSNVKRAALDPASGVVTVDFANDKTYRYGNFTTMLMREWAEAKSPGSWFHNNVRQRPDAYPLLGDDGKPTGAPVPTRPQPAPSEASPTATPAPKQTVKAPPLPDPVEYVDPEPQPDPDEGKKRTAARIEANRQLLLGVRIKHDAPAPAAEPDAELAEK